MSLKESLQGKLIKITDDVLPHLQESLADIRKRLDNLNSSLASRAIPEQRRSRVQELAIQEKAQQAGQGAKAGKPASGKRSSGKGR